MTYRTISLIKLRVNRNNDRHGEQGSEERAIAWLLTSRAAHMRNLAKDIVDSDGLYEPPLVMQDGLSFTVLDGNRRVTCLKLLRNPKLATTAEFERYFTNLAARWGRIPSSIVCQVEVDGDRIDEILYRRHTGSQGGVGQSAWDDRAKQNFIERTGKKTRIDAADEVCALLRKAGHVVDARKVPRSNLNRLLSAESFRNRLGFSTKGNRFTLTHNEPAVAKALLKVSTDLITKKVVLGTLWDNDAKREYLNSVEREGFLPKTEDLQAQSSTPGASIRATLASLPRSQPAPPAIRRNLIPPDIDYGISWLGDTARVRDIWNELSHRLTLSDHPNAVGVLFRLLLELSIEYYATAHGIAFPQNEKLAKKVEKVAADLRCARLIDAKHESELKRFAQSEQIISAQTMNSYVHSPRFSPSPEHLITMWNVLANFIVACLTT